MLNPEIQEFIESVRKMPAAACILAPANSLSKIALLLEGQISCFPVDPTKPLPKVVPPAILLASEEDYSGHPDWAEKLRTIAAYFFNVG